MKSLILIISMIALVCSVDSFGGESKPLENESLEALPDASNVIVSKRKLCINGTQYYYRIGYTDQFIPIVLNGVPQRCKSNGQTCKLNVLSKVECK